MQRQLILKEKLHTDFAQRFCTLRDARGLNNIQLGKAVALTHVTIGNYAGGQFPKAEHLLTLAKFFGVTTDFLLTGERFLTETALRETPVDYKVTSVDGALAQVAACEQMLGNLRKTLETMKNR